MGQTRVIASQLRQVTLKKATKNILHTVRFLCASCGIIGCRPETPVDFFFSFLLLMWRSDRRESTTKQQQRKYLRNVGKELQRGTNLVPDPTNNTGSYERDDQTPPRRSGKGKFGYKDAYKSAVRPRCSDMRVKVASCLIPAPSRSQKKA